ncbi:DUF2613 domain-containing protein [Deltaproteobacteria bacterium TL4]
MAEDDLEGLDDFGDGSDFSEEGMDDFMDTDLGGDAGGDGDSELDSFFEDLSTIDDLEVQEEEPEAEAEPEAEEQVFTEPEETEPEEKKPLLIPAIISAVSGIVLGIIGVVMVWVLNRPEPPPPLPPPPPTPVVMPMPEPVQERIVYVQKEEPPPLPPPPPPVAVKKMKYFIQVANCIYKECVDDYRFLLKKHGYPAELEIFPETTPMTEIVSSKTFGEEDASTWVRQINQDNQLAGQAFRKKAGDRFHISLGFYPDLDTANRVKSNLNQIYAGQIFFEANRAEQRIRYTKIRTTGFETRQDAVEVQNMLMKQDKRFKDGFIISKIE